MILVSWLWATSILKAEEAHRFLYVAAPGVRNLLEYGGHGLLVFDIDRNYQFVRRIPTGGLDEKNVPLNVKGIAASAATDRIYISTLRSVLCLDLKTDSLLWEKNYEGGCDRLAISPDGTLLYVPSLEKMHWNVVDARTGELKQKITTNSGAHNTVYHPNGREVFLGGLLSPYLMVAETSRHDVARKIGPFSGSVRPFTINTQGTLCFVNVNGLLGFEVGDLKSGQVLHQVEVQGFHKGEVKRHGCPSHGIGLTPDGRELWLADSFNKRIHIFDTAVMPPRQKDSILLRDEPGWITFALDGRRAYPSTGEVIDVKTRKVVAQLKDEEGRFVQSEKLLEIDFKNGEPVRAGNQFGLGPIRR